MSAPGFIHDLCVALAHRWEPERVFVILTAYFDESGTHGESPLQVMAGFVGDARQWRKFEKRTAKLFARYRVDIFHTIDVKRSDDDFRGWSVDKKIEFIDEFQHIVNQTVERGFASILSKTDYAYYTGLNWPKGTRKDSIYGLLFRASLSAAVDDVALAGERGRLATEPKLNIVLESGHRNAPDAIRLYNLFCAQFGEARALGGLTFAGKDNCLPLAAADLFAYSAWGNEVGNKPIGVPRKPTKSGASYRGNAHRIEITRQTLTELHQLALSGATSESWRPRYVSFGQSS